MKTHNRLKKALLYFLTAVIFIFGALIFLFPLANRAMIDHNTQATLDNFRALRISEDSESKGEASDVIGITPVKYDDLYRDMQKYNENIYENGQSGLSDAWSYEKTVFDLSSYGISDGIVGEIRIPAMDCDLPIYLGATKRNMAKGAAQLSQTSMPIGGENTNCVIAAHRGAAGGKFFLDIEKLKIGDSVYIDNLWETLDYKVSDIKIIKPNEIDRVLIQEGKDMVTLTTCHPYPYNYQRYIVYCTRAEMKTETPSESSTVAEIETKESAAESAVIEDSSQNFIELEMVLYLIIPILLLILFIVLMKISSKRKGINS